MSRRADAVCGSQPSPVCDSELRSGVGPASIRTDRWPLSSYLELGALPSAVTSARLHARLVVGEWGHQAIADDVELITSELVTNALLASTELTGSRFRGVWSPGTPPIRLWLHADKSRVRIRVWDGNDRVPLRRSSDLLQESGHGLLLVETLSAQVGVYRLEGSTGKVVWAEVAS